MPQATEKAQNGPDQRLATPRLATPQDSIASPLHRLVRPTADPGFLLHRQTDYWLIDAPVADHVSLSGPNHALAIDVRRKRGVHHI